MFERNTSWGYPSRLSSILRQLPRKNIEWFFQILIWQFQTRLKDGTPVELFCKASILSFLPSLYSLITTRNADSSSTWLRVARINSVIRCMIDTIQLPNSMTSFRTRESMPLSFSWPNIPNHPPALRNRLYAYTGIHNKIWDSIYHKTLKQAKKMNKHLHTLICSCSGFCCEYKTELALVRMKKWNTAN